MSSESSTEEMLARLEHDRARRHSVQGMISGAFMVTIVVLVALLSLFNILALNRLEKQTQDLRADLQINQRLETIASANAVARSAKDVADDMRDVRRAARDEIQRSGLSPAQAKTAAGDARDFLLGATQRLPMYARLVASETDQGRRMANLSKVDIAMLNAARALRAFDLASAEALNPAVNKALAKASFEALARDVPELKKAVEKMRALEALPGKASIAQAGLAQLYFITAQKLNYRTDLCEKVAALSASVENSDPYPLRVVISNGDCLRKTGQVAKANQEFSKAVTAYETGERRGRQRRPELNYRALRGRATTAIALPDSADKAADKARFEQAIVDLKTAAQFSKSNGETAAQQQGILENIGFAYLRMGDVKAAVEHTQKVDQITPQAWNLSVQAIAAKAAGNRALEREAREKLKAFRRPQFNECEMRRLLGRYAGDLEPILESARDADITPGACPGA